MSQGFLPLPVNLNEVDAAKGYDYPPGIYIFKILDFENRTTKDGTGQRLHVNLEIVMGPDNSSEYTGRKFSSGYNLTAQAMPFLKRFILSTGITEQDLANTGGNFDPNWLPGRSFVATLAKNKEGYLNINNEKSLDEWSGAPPQPTQASPDGNLMAAQPAQVAPAAATMPAQVPAQPAYAPPAQPAYAPPAQAPAPVVTTPAQPAPAPAPAPALQAPPAQPAPVQPAATAIPSPAPPPGQVPSGQ